MQEYPVKRGLTKDLEGRMVQALKECFETEPVKSGNHYQISYGALKLLEVTMGGGGKTLVIRTESDRSATDAIILDTNKRFRKYLDIVTGYPTKERVKRSKSVEKE